MKQRLVLWLCVVGAVGAAVWAWAGLTDGGTQPVVPDPPGPAVAVPLAPPSDAGDPAAHDDATKSSGLSPQDVQRLSQTVERVDAEAGTVTLLDAHGTEHTVKAQDVFTREDLVAHLGWSPQDVLGETSAFWVASSFLSAATSTHYDDGGAASLFEAQEWATGEALALVRQWRADVLESGPSAGEVAAQEVTTSLVTLMWAPRTVADRFGPTTRDRVVLLAHYELRPSTPGAAIVPRDTVLVVERTGDGWRVSQWPQDDLGGQDGEPGQGD